MILVVAKNPIRPEYADNWAEHVRGFTDATRAEPGNICFDWYRSVEDPNVYVLVEAFADAAAGEAHVQSDHFKAAGKLLAKMLSGIPDIVNIEVPQGWSRMAEVPAEVGDN